AKSLGQIGPDALPALQQALKDPSWGRAKVWLISALEAMGPTAAPAVPELTKSLDANGAHPDTTVMRALGAIGPGAKEAVPALLKASKRTDANGFYSREASQALTKIGTPEA